MSGDLADLLAVPTARARAMRPLLDRLLSARRVALTTHVNADGDGAGSQAAVAAWLEGRGIEVAIVNPTRFPPGLKFLLHREDLAVDGPGSEAQRILDAAELVLVLDTSESNRLEPLTPHLMPERTLVVDHHPPGPAAVGEGVQDPTAAATGELVYDLVALAGDEWSYEMARGVYVAIVSDTGSFRFSNSTPRAHAIAADMIQLGVEPEPVYQRLYASFPRRRFELLRAALASLEHDPELGLSWMVIPAETTRALRVTSEDFEGLVDHARAVEGTRVAILFRGLDDGSTKLSLRSNGDVDVNRIARSFGGGGHVKAAGALVKAPPASAVPRVLAAVREALRR